MALCRTLMISKVNLSLRYFCLIKIWKSEVQGWNLWKIFGILMSGFGHNKVTSNKPWNTETHKTDRNLSSKHQSTGDLGEMRYPNRLLSKNLPLCTCNYPFYSAYNSLNHRVNSGQFKLCTDIEKNPGPSVNVDATKTDHDPYCQGNVTVFGEMLDNNVSQWVCAL